MKKNRLFVLGLVTVFVALVSLTFVSSTWAKYTTTATGSDQARVAYWGFNEASIINLTGLFSNQHKNGEDKVTVKAQDGSDVIAPGTTGSTTFQFNYKANGAYTAPEVAYNFTVDTTGSQIDPAIVANTNIQWKLDTGEWGTFEKLLADIEALSGEADGSKYYEPNNLPSAFNQDGPNKHTITWQWLIGDDAASSEKDTAMGNTLDLADVKVVITITAEQVD